MAPHPRAWHRIYLYLCAVYGTMCNSGAMLVGMASSRPGTIFNSGLAPVSGLGCLLAWYPHITAPSMVPENFLSWAWHRITAWQKLRAGGWSLSLAGAALSSPPALCYYREEVAMGNLK